MSADPSSGHSKELLPSYIRRVKAVREEVRQLNADKAEIKKEARDAGAERARICAELAVKGWRAAGAMQVDALRPRAGLDFNDAIRERVR